VRIRAVAAISPRHANLWEFQTRPTRTWSSTASTSARLAARDYVPGARFRSTVSKAYAMTGRGSLASRSASGDPRPRRHEVPYTPPATSRRWSSRRHRRGSPAAGLHRDIPRELKARRDSVSSRREDSGGADVCPASAGRARYMRSCDFDQSSVGRNRRRAVGLVANGGRT